MSSKQRPGSSPSLLNVEARQGNLLSPASDPIDIVPPQLSRKRKHADIDDQKHLGGTFAIQAHPSLPSPKAHHLTPRLLLHRSSLPLAYLDPTGIHGNTHGPRLFSARIEALEAKLPRPWQSPPVILVAHSTDDDRLYAVERIQDGIYALCILGSWVGLKTLEQLRADGQNHESMFFRQHAEQIRPWEREWWRATTIEPDYGINASSETSPGAEKIRDVRLCLQRPVPSETRSTTVKEKSLAHLEPVQTETALNTMVGEASQRPEEVLETIKAQYLEALYASKTSLAYFAKGPLSRARAAYRSCDGSSYDPSNLIQYLRSNILSLTTMDIKYRETLPGLVKDIPLGSLSDDEGVSVLATVGKKARKSRKNKVGKNGLYCGEDTSATQWWLKRDTSDIACGSANAREDGIKEVLFEQRARETQLQIILVLETLALEASAGNSSAVNVAPTDLPQGERGLPKMSKKRHKPQDLSTLVEILADRLCIWQSMSTDEAKTSQVINKPENKNGNETTITVTGHDHLRQFCVDIILPFFGARLPNLTTMLCQKLGGPKQPSPKRVPLVKTLISTAAMKPGSSLQRQQPQKPRRTLERVLTDERSASQRPPPPLSRSTTEPVLPRLKREESDTSLSSIPLNRVAMHKRYSQREVDLNAASQAAEAKVKRKAKIEEELRGAIAALKRPNPRMAVKELMEDAEKRITGLHSRKSKNPIRYPSAQSVQIMATPSKNRRHHVFPDLPQIARPNSAFAAVAAADLEDVPSSNVPQISDSTQKTKQSSTIWKDWAPRSSNNNSGGLTVEQTPSRRPSRLLGCLLTPSIDMAAEETRVYQSPHSTRLKPSEAIPGLNKSPSLPMWFSKIHQTPSKGRTADHFDRKEPIVEATPEKSVLSIQDFTNPSAVTALSSSQEQETSIYTSLGWDDDADDLV